MKIVSPILTYKQHVYYEQLSEDGFMCDSILTLFSHWTISPKRIQFILTDKKSFWKTLFGRQIKIYLKAKKYNNEIEFIRTCIYWGKSQDDCCQSFLPKANRFLSTRLLLTERPTKFYLGYKKV